MYHPICLLTELSPTKTYPIENKSTMSFNEAKDNLSFFFFPGSRSQQVQPDMLFVPLKVWAKVTCSYARDIQVYDKPSMSYNEINLIKLFTCEDIYQSFFYNSPLFISYFID
jgi:hypothetical protein